VTELTIYKEISFFEQGAGNASSRSALFSGRAGALACKQALKNNYAIKFFPPDFK
jgi:hypothetical protein